MIRTYRVRTNDGLFYCGLVGGAYAFAEKDTGIRVTEEQFHKMEKDMSHTMKLIAEKLECIAFRSSVNEAA